MSENIVDNKKIMHCCDLMTVFICDPRIGVEYCSEFREFSIDLRFSYTRQNIFYCPWCGYKLPEWLSDKYYEILQEEYGIDDPHNDEQEKLIPEEFKSDKWWKKRGL